MRMLSTCIGILSTIVTVVCVPAARSDEARRVDVVVYGGTAGGVIGAVAAAREGKTVLLLEPGKHVGGMVSGGLGATDYGNRAAIGGYSREFFDRVRAYYVKKYGTGSPQVKDCSDGFRFEPHVAELIFKEMLKEAKVEVLFEQRRLLTVSKTGRRVDFIVTNDGHTFVYNKSSASVFIDATYEGDLMAKAKVSYAIGREGRDQYNESIAGVQARSLSHQWPVPVSPWNGDKLLPFVRAGPAGEAGAADKKTQAYNFRLCMTQRKDNQVPFPKPAKYDPSQYELLTRFLAKKPGLKVGQMMNPVAMPNGKTDTNNNGPLSTDFIGGNWEYPEGDYATRERIWQEHVDYVQGFMYFLANDPRVPPALHAEMATWGLAKDEFTDTGNWPHQLYVREARRMLGEFVMSQADIMDQRTKDDSVGLGSYNTDSHHVQRVPTKDGAVINEGDFQVRVQPYAIPYRSLVPRPAECENLLVPVCMSASHVAYGTVRMEPVYMVLGQATGVAAALAIDGKTPVQKIPMDRLLSRLKAQKAVLSPVGLSSPATSARRLEQSKLGGIVVDHGQAAKTGDWLTSTALGPFVGEGYLHDNNQAKGQMRVRFTPKLPKEGRYEVRLFYTANPNRATNTPVVIHSAEGERTVKVHQRLAPQDNQAVSLGVLGFAAGESGWVEIRNDDNDGFVIADAVQFLPVK
jgi:hypothetical protein